MTNERVDAVLAWLAPHLLSSTDTLELRSLLEELYDSGADDLVQNLVTVEYAAARWDVSERRARAHIAALKAKRAIGWKIGDSWVLRRSDVDDHAPQQKYRKPAHRPKGE